jgi:hypothetical protein
MPSIKAPLRIPATKGKGAWPLLSIFPGDHEESWIKRGGRQDNFRILFGNRFYSRPNERCSFLSAAELGLLLGKRIADVFGVVLGDALRETVTVNLYLPQGAKVWYRQPGKLPSAELIAAPPYQLGSDWVVMLRYSGEIVPVTSVKPRVVSLAEASIEPEECKGDTHDKE